MLCMHKTTILCQFGLIICHQLPNHISISSHPFLVGIVSKKSSRDVREWKVTHDLMFCPSAVVLGSFIKTSMTCSQTGGIEGGSGGVIKVGMLEGGLAGCVEASGQGGGGGRGQEACQGTQSHWGGGGGRT